jgi:type IV secretion system protein TrbL
MEILDTIFGIILDSLQQGTTALAFYAIPILSFTGMMYMTWQIIQRLVFGTVALNEMLGSLLMMVVTIMFYIWVFQDWEGITEAALETMLWFAIEGGASGDVDVHALLTTPSVIWAAGMKAAKPIADFDTWQRGLATAWNFTVNPTDLLSFLTIVVSFLVLTLHHGVLLLEFQLAAMLGVVLLPFALLRPLGHLGEFALGWVSGSAIRAMISTTIVGLAYPTFAEMAPAAPPAPTTLLGQLSAMVIPAAPTWTHVISTMGASLLFFVLCMVVPARSARLAGVTLGLSASDIGAGAMSLARYGMMLSGAVRGTSNLIRMARA